MDRTLVDFVKVLRTAEIKVSPAETLDAMECMNIVGYEDRTFLKNSLAVVLAKNPEEKDAFYDCFDRFFAPEEFSRSEDSDDSENTDHNDFDDNDGDFNPNEGNNQQSGKGGGQGGGQGGGGEQEEEELNEETTLQPTSELGKLLMTGSKTEQTIAMMEAGREVEVNQIVVFTQKGLYTRKIMDAMGLKGLQEEVSELQGHGGLPQRILAKNLKKARDLLREKVRDSEHR